MGAGLTLASLHCKVAMYASCLPLLLPPIPAVLTLYLVRFLSYEEDTATALYHTFIVLCYLSPVLGAIIADSCLGKFV